MGDRVRIRVQGTICMILAFWGIINDLVLIWIGKKTNRKGMQYFGAISLICIMSLLVVVLLMGDNEKIMILATYLMLILTMLPIPIILISVKDFVSCQTLEMFLEKNHINVDKLEDAMFVEIRVYPDKRTRKNAQYLYGDKWEVVLRAIQYAENKQRIIKENEKKAKQKEKESRKEELKRQENEKKVNREQEKVEARRIALKQAETEAKKAEAEKAKAEAMKMQAEAEKAKAEAEARKAEAKKAEAESKKVEARKMQVEDEIKITSGQNNTERRSGNLEKNIRKIDINLCSEQELSLVEGVGIILAKKAIRIRNEKGPFGSVDEFIQEVGIRENNKELVMRSLVCEIRESVSENYVRRHGRKIDL